MPEGTTHQFSYIESRGGKYEKTVFFGLQYYLKKYLDVTITHEMVDYAKSRVSKHMMPDKSGVDSSFNEDGWRYIVDRHNGKLPLKIRAVPEGMIVPTRNILMSVENTDPNCFWLTSYVETLLLKVWYPITVASTSYRIKQIIKESMELSCDDLSGLPFKLHDFGYRGVSSEESAEIGGAAHLCNFMGTDTFMALEFLKEFYGCDMAGYSIDATEHSTVTSWKREREKEAYAHFRNIYKNKPIFACVSDSYDITAAMAMWGEMAQQIRDDGQVVVIRPDSGDPKDMSLHCLKELEKHFGVVINSKGYKVLNNTRVIYGDGISSPEVIKSILDNALENGYSAENLAFGMGGGLLQKCDRDTQKFAMKCSHITTIYGEVDVYKDPVTDPGKKSKRGKLDLIRNDKGELETVRVESGGWSQNGHLGFGHDYSKSVMQTVYENGKILIDTNLDEIRKRTES